MNSQLEHLRVHGQHFLYPTNPRITVGMSTCGVAAGAAEVLNAIQENISSEDSSIDVVSVGCRGLCYAEPVVEIFTDSNNSYLLGKLEPKDAKAIIETARTGTLHQKLVDNLIEKNIRSLEERRVMSNCGIIDPSSIEEYCACGGYAALQSALTLTPDEIINCVELSGLRGRGGAGFSVGEKWRVTAETPMTERYFIVNGDEGDPGAYMDRGLLESDPHRVLEGLIIGAYATHCNRAYFFVRAEYPKAVSAIKLAIQQAYDNGFLGKNILESAFSLEVSVVCGAGAFLCGESTAMINVLENKWCTTKPTPPYPAEQGLWGKPTCVNNVETLANIPLIVEHGPDFLKQIGTPKSPGTKIFSMTGSTDKSGLVELPLGITFGDVLNNIACSEDAKAVQIGGPSGAILPAALKNIEISYEGLNDIGGMMGSGGFVIISNDQCIVDTALYLTRFVEGQSCNKCALCRDSLSEAVQILERIVAGDGRDADLDRLHELCRDTQTSNLCGLGRTSLNPVYTSLKYFPEEYQAHLNKECPGHVCQDLISYSIIPEKCQGERCCLQTCPGNAIKGSFGKPGHIVPRLCQKCGMCVISCPYEAVKINSPA